MRGQSIWGYYFPLCIYIFNGCISGHILTATPYVICKTKLPLQWADAWPRSIHQLMDSEETPLFSTYTLTQTT